MSNESEKIKYFAQGSDSSTLESCELSLSLRGFYDAIPFCRLSAVQHESTSRERYFSLYDRLFVLSLN